MLVGDVLKSGLEFLHSCTHSRCHISKGDRESKDGTFGYYSVGACIHQRLRHRWDIFLLLGWGCFGHIRGVLSLVEWRCKLTEYDLVYHKSNRSQTVVHT